MVGTKTRTSRRTTSLTKWSAVFLKATDHDRWEKELMAVSLYENLRNDLENFVETGKIDINNNVVMDLTPQQKGNIKKISHCISCRINNLKHDNSSNWMTLNELMKLKIVMKDILSWQGVFPVLIQETQAKSYVSLLSSTDSGLGDGSSDEEVTDEDDDAEELLPRLRKITGYTRMSIKLEKIGLKTTDLIEPYIVVSVRDSASVNLTPIQYISEPKLVEDFHLHFDTRIEVQKYIEKIPKGSHIFFELRHKKKGKMATKCFAVLKKSEFQTSKAFLELYKGPADYHMKNIVKFTNKKPLFLHADIKLLD